MRSFPKLEKPRSTLLFSLFIYWILLLGYSIFSYALTDPNLVLLSWQPYQSFQNFMWTTFFENSQLLSAVFLFLISALFLQYFDMIRRLSTFQEDLRSLYLSQLVKMFLLYLVLIFPLLLSYNALSHDVFNYMFNAKMVAQYDANPHVQVALDFPHDPWTRFMHNTHTPAPYGYGWTLLSLIPYSLGMGKFFITWLLFRAFSVMSIFLLLISLWLLARKLNKQLSLRDLAILFLNPLFLIEIVSNIHNDLWMLVPAMLSLMLMTTSRITQPRALMTLSSAGLLGLSIYIKFATIALIPVWIFLVAQNNLLFEKTSLLHVLPQVKGVFLFASRFLSNFINRWWPHVASILLFLPLLTSQSKHFLPWYLVWSLVWLPLLDWKPWKHLLLTFSISSLLRYLPWLWAGNYDRDVLFYQRLITWLIPAIYLVFLRTSKQVASQSRKNPIPLKAKTVE